MVGDEPFLRSIESRFVPVWASIRAECAVCAAGFASALSVALGPSEIKSGPFAFSGFYANCPVPALDHFFDDRQPNPTSFLLGARFEGLEHLENAGVKLGCNARAIVGDPKLD